MEDIIDEFERPYIGFSSLRSSTHANLSLRMSLDYSTFSYFCFVIYRLTELEVISSLMIGEIFWEVIKGPSILITELSFKSYSDFSDSIGEIILLAITGFYNFSHEDGYSISSVSNSFF